MKYILCLSKKKKNEKLLFYFLIIILKEKQKKSKTSLLLLQYLHHLFSSTLSGRCCSIVHSIKNKNSFLKRKRVQCLSNYLHYTFIFIFFSHLRYYFFVFIFIAYNVLSITMSSALKEEQDSIFYYFITSFKKITYFCFC